jgi:hypothetical protein
VVGGVVVWWIVIYFVYIGLPLNWEGILTPGAQKACRNSGPGKAVTWKAVTSL